jgi:biopolymer transport protein ExbD
LAPELKKEIDKKKDSIVLLRVDKTVPYRTVQRLIAAVKSTGARSIALAVEPPKK